MGNNNMKRKTEFANGEYYHIYNRGVDKRKVFLDLHDYERFLLGMWLMNDEKDGLMEQWRNYCNNISNPKASPSGFRKSHLSKEKPLVEIIAYCLNPNHYHFILKQIEEKGIENFMQKIGTGYAMYFNKKNDRSGVLFQGVFKSIHIDSNDYLLYLSAYVNKNNFIHGYSKNDSWAYSSFPDYIGRREDKLSKRNIILGQFKNKKEYKEFADINALYLKEKKELEK
jgi:putative transposase